MASPITLKTMMGTPTGVKPRYGKRWYPPSEDGPGAWCWTLVNHSELSLGEKLDAEFNLFLWRNPITFTDIFLKE